MTIQTLLTLYILSISFTLTATSIRYCNADNQTPLIVFHTDPATGHTAMTPVQPGGAFQSPTSIGFFVCNKNVCGFPAESLLCTDNQCSSSCSMAAVEGRENVFVTVGYLGTGLTSFVGTYPLNITTDSCLSPNFLQAINLQRQGLGIIR